MTEGDVPSTNGESSKISVVAIGDASRAFCRQREFIATMAVSPGTEIQTGAFSAFYLQDDLLLCKTFPADYRNEKSGRVRFLLKCVYIRDN